MTDEMLEKLNAASELRAAEILSRCCGARAWVDAMVKRRPFADEDAVFEAAEQVWFALSPDEWMEAFDHHPRIGANVAALREKYASTSDWAEGEQAGVNAASEATLEALAQGNREYEARYGFLFLVCATGKSADEMLNLLEGRMENSADDELEIAAEEQAKITRIRLEKL